MINQFLNLKNSCQKSPSLKKYVCCGKPNKNDDDDDLTDAKTLRKRPNTDVCEKGFPYIQNGIPLTCAVGIYNKYIFQKKTEAIKY